MTSAFDQKFSSFIAAKSPGTRKRVFNSRIGRRPVSTDTKDVKGKDDQTSPKMSRQTLRQKTVTEIVETEKDYLNDLVKIREVFLTPLRANPKLMSSEEIEKIFSNVELLLGVNLELEPKLDEMKEGKRVGEMFLGIADYLKMYSQYCTNYDNAMMTLVASKKKNPALTKFLNDQVNSEACHGLDLGSFLIKPMQRICKYPLLFRELKKFTDPDHDDYQNIISALEKMNQVAQYVNEKKAQSENMQLMLTIRDRIQDLGKLQFITPSRRYIKEGVLVKLSPRNVPQERYFYLFSDMLLYCKGSNFEKKTSMLYYRGNIDLTMVLVSENVTDEKGTSFHLVRMDKKKKKYTIIAKTPEEKCTWIIAIDKAASEIQKRDWQVREETRRVEIGSDSSSFDENDIGNLSPVVPRSASPRSPKSSSSRLSRTTAGRSNKIGPLNSNHTWNAAARAPFLVAYELCKFICTLVKELDQTSEDPTKVSSFDLDRVALEELKTSAPFIAFEEGTAELQRVELMNMGEEERLCFFVNIYNALFLHGLVALRPALDSPAQRFAFAKRCSYQVGVFTFSLMDIEFGILRATVKSSYQLRKGDLRLKHIISYSDPMVVFACGSHVCARDGPPLRPYSPTQFRQELARQVASHCMSTIAVNGKSVSLPTVFQVHHKDFVSARQALAWVFDLLHEKGSKLDDLLQEHRETLQLIEKILNNSKSKSALVDFRKPYNFYPWLYFIE